MSESELNQSALVATNALAQFKGNLLNEVLSCRLFTNNYPLLIDHIRREALFFINVLTNLQNRVVINLAAEAAEQEAFWNRIMAEHAKFIRGLLDPTEVQLFNTANSFGAEFDNLTAQALSSSNQPTIVPQVTADSLNATVRIRNFKVQGTEGVLDCKVRALAYPLLGDHIIREANRYIRVLSSLRDSS